MIKYAKQSQLRAMLILSDDFTWQKNHISMHQNRYFIGKQYRKNVFV